MNLIDSMNPFQHTVLAYLVGVGLLWGYAAKIWWSSRRYKSYTQEQATEPGSSHT